MQTKSLPVVIEKSDSAAFDARFIMSAATPDRVHYVYKLTARNPIDRRKYYIGVRTCDGAPSKDSGYMSSSRYVQAAIDAGVVFDKNIICVGFDRIHANDIEQALLGYHYKVNREEFFNRGIVTSDRFTTIGPFDDARRAIALEAMGRPEVRAKIGAANSIALRGKKQTTEQIAKRVEKLKGHVVSKETRKKIGAANSRALLGKSLSEEHRKAISEGNKGKIRTDDQRAAISRRMSGKEQSPEHKEAARLARIAAYARPEVKERMRAAQKARFEREKAAKNVS